MSFTQSLTHPGHIYVRIDTVTVYAGGSGDPACAAQPMPQFINNNIIIYIKSLKAPFSHVH